MSIFAEVKSKLWLDWETCWNNALFKLPIFYIFCVLSGEHEGSEMLQQYISIYNSYNGYNKHRRLKIGGVDGYSVLIRGSF